MERRLLRVGIHQAPPGSGITPAERSHYRSSGIEVLILPEYFWVRPGDEHHGHAARHAEEDLDALASLSREEAYVLVGGTVVESRGEGLHNACPVFMNGEELGRYRKIHLMPGEARHGLSPGEGFLVVEALGLRLAPVLCADVLYPDTFRQVAALEPDLILAPMSSPYRHQESPAEKDARDREIFLKGASFARAPIVKAGGPGTLFGRPLQGRSLVATPEEILFRTPFEEETERRTWVVPVPVPLRTG
jgi:predicted amidohydrolase